MSQTVSSKATSQQWLAVAGVVLGAFVAILDTSITNSSLQDIQGSLSASLSEGSWISTSYLVTEIMIIPLTAFFCRVFSTRLYLLANVVIFLLFSALCGLAHSLGSMILFRACQGIAGGALIPVAITVIVTMLPATQQAIGFALFGLATTFAPALGPSLGGWLTSHYGWPYIFYINLLPGAPLLLLLARNIPREPMNLRELKQADWWGILSMSMFLGTLTTILEEGNREDWLSSAYISRLTVICAASFVAFLFVELTRKNPVVDLRLLARRNFLLSCIMSFTLGVAIYAPNYVTPVYMGSILGFDALETGRVMMWMGFPQLLVMPLVPALIHKIDARGLLWVGYALLAASFFMNSGLTLDFGKTQFAWCLVVRALAIPFMITPSTAIAYDGIEPENVGNASGLFNMVRNLGGSVGIGLISTFASRRYTFHFARLAENFSYTDSASLQRLSGLQKAFMLKGADASIAYQQAIQAMNGVMTRESYILSYADCFYLLAVTTLLCTVCIFFMNKPQGGAAGPAH
ncbi:MAG: MDR family MFS transporter [Oligoflexia bacterium]|nr:MDR family MFS transporter [Oligoflexia bacterium]